MTGDKPEKEKIEVEVRGVCQYCEAPLLKSERLDKIVSLAELDTENAELQEKVKRLQREIKYRRETELILERELKEDADFSDRTEHVPEGQQGQIE
jgi:hypothetical protein